MPTNITALHGMLGEPADWDFLRTSLGPEFQFETPDLFQERWHADLSGIGALINSESAGDILLGYSMGARLALHALAESPTRWRAAIIVSAHPGLAPKDRPSRLLADQVWAQKARAEEWPTFIEDWNAQPALSSDSPSPDRTHLVSHRESIANAFDRWSLARQQDLSPLFPNIPTPILWITGEQDSKFTDLATSACSLFPAATHTIIPASRHRPPWENPPAFVAALQKFLN